MEDRRTDIELADLRAMRQASKIMSHQAAVAEQIGTVGIFVLHKKPSLIQRIKNRLGGK